MAAVLAMMGSRGNKRYESNEGDIQDRHASHGNDPCDVTSQGAANAPGDDAVSQAGARDPQKSAGALVGQRQTPCCCVSACKGQRKAGDA